MTAAYVQHPLTPSAAGQPECCLPACTEPSPAVGQPCNGCRATFGSYLVQSDRAAPGAEVLAAELAARDEGIREQYRAQRALAAAQPEPERKQNQTCWLCDEKRTCTRLPGGWECDRCREVS